MDGVHDLWSRCQAVVVTVWKWAAAAAVTMVVAGGLIQYSRIGEFNSDRLFHDAPWPPESSIYVAGMVALFALVLAPAGLALLAFLAAATYPLFLRPLLLGIGELMFSLIDGHDSRRIMLSTTADIDSLTKHLAETRHHVLRPRLSVLSVDAPIWRHTVLELAWSFSVVLIDISVPTPNVLWEVEQVTAAQPGRCVLMGEVGCLQRLAHGALTEPGEIRLAEISREHPVLAYTSFLKGRGRSTPCSCS